MQAIIAFILIFSIIVIVHEFGHYFFAKRAGILVREFAIGMGPKIYHYEGDETTYTIRLLPIGGYVRMAGLEETEDSLAKGMQVVIETDKNETVQSISTVEEEKNFSGLPLEVIDADLEDQMFIEGIPFGESQPRRFSVSEKAFFIEPDGTKLKVAPRHRQYQSASIGHRLMTNFAGPMNNFILAIVAFIILGFVQGGVPTNSNIIGDVQPNSPAAESGIKADDEIIAINDENILSFEAMGKAIEPHSDEKITVTIKRDNQTRDLQLTPEGVDAGENKKVAKIGVMPKRTLNPIKVIGSGFVLAWQIVAAVFAVLISMFKTGFDINNFGGPVYMYQATSQVVSLGVTGLLSWLGALSVNLGIVNLLPIPALDGGKLVLNIIELIRGKPLSPKVEGYINVIGVVLVFILMIAVTWNDILRFFS